MALPKFYTFCSVLQKAELFNFKKYVASQTNHTSDLIKIMDGLALVNWETVNPSNVDQLKSKIHPSSKEKIYSNHLSSLFTLAQDWMVKEQLEHEKFSTAYLKQKWLNRKGLHQMADKIAEETVANINNEPDDLFKLSILTAIQFEKILVPKTKQAEVNIDEMTCLIKTIEEFCAIKLFVLDAELKSIKAIRKEEHKNEYLQKYIHLNCKSNLYKLTKLAHEIIVTENVNSIHELKQMLFADETINKKGKMHHLITSYLRKRSINYFSMGLINDANFLRDTTEYAIKHGSFEENGKLQTMSYHNIIGSLSAALSLEELIDFANKWIHHVNTYNKEETLSLAYAQAYFYNHQFEKINKYALLNILDDNQKILSHTFLLIASFMERKQNSATFKAKMSNTKKLYERMKPLISENLYKSLINLYHFMMHYDKDNNYDATALKPLIYKTWVDYVVREKL